MIGIFFPVDRRHMCWIFIKVRSPDSKLRVRVDPVPQFFTCGPSLRIIVTIYADKISREPVAITAAKTPAMVRPVRRSLQTTCEGLTVIITECARYARPEPSIVHRAKSVIQLQLETPVHASDIPLVACRPFLPP